MNERIKELATQIGIDVNYLTNTKQIVLIEKFAESIILECVACCGSQADKKNIRYRFGLPIESDVQYEAPPVYNSITSQYTRKYNLPGSDN
jgi:hypothetical protein